MYDNVTTPLAIREPLQTETCRDKREYCCKPHTSLCLCQRRRKAGSRVRNTMSSFTQPVSTRKSYDGASSLDKYGLACG